TGAEDNPISAARPLDHPGTAPADHRDDRGGWYRSGLAGHRRTAGGGQAQELPSGQGDNSCELPSISASFPRRVDKFPGPGRLKPSPAPFIARRTTLVHPPLSSSTRTRQL